VPHKKEYINCLTSRPTRKRYSGTGKKKVERKHKEASTITKKRNLLGSQEAFRGGKETRLKKNAQGNGEERAGSTAKEFGVGLDSFRRGPHNQPQQAKSSGTQRQGHLNEGPSKERREGGLLMQPDADPRKSLGIQKVGFFARKGHQSTVGKAQRFTSRKARNGESLKKGATAQTEVRHCNRGKRTSVRTAGWKGVTIRKKPCLFSKRHKRWLLEKEPLSLDRVLLDAEEKGEGNTRIGTGKNHIHGKTDATARTDRETNSNKLS